MSLIYSFPAIDDANAKVLILGSMPGVASLRAAQYYAHPRNLFWHFMRSLFSLPTDTTYEQNIQALKLANVALWDVLHACSRQGSLDSRIEKLSQAPNDFQAFYAAHRNITHVFFNGAVAEQSYRNLVLPGLQVAPIRYLRLPSTSPANTAMSYDYKLQAWQAIRCVNDPARLD